MSFALPKNGSVYVSTIVDRCQRLIRSGVWSEIQPASLASWLNNFTGEEERYFSAVVLDSLIFRSELQTVSMMRDIFDLELPSINAERNNTLWNLNLNAYFKDTAPRNNRPLMIVPVIRRNDPPTKSGPMIARLLKRHLHFDQYHTAWPWQIAEWSTKFKTGGVLFIDDLLGTGDQFQKFVTHFELEPFISNLKCVYCPLAAHQEGINKLKKSYPTLDIVCADLLNERHNIFDANHSPFNDSVNNSVSAKAFYLDMIQRKGLNVRRPSGHGDLGMTYAFHHGTPNNSLAILWESRSSNWNPLLKR